MGSWIRQAGDSVGNALGYERGSAVDPDASLGEQYYRLATGGWGFIDGVLYDVQGDESASRESWVPSEEPLRKAIDTVVDYEGEWGGKTDTVDIVGPPVYGREGSVIDHVLNEQGEGVELRAPGDLTGPGDVFDPDTIVSRIDLLIKIGIIVAVLYLLAPVFNLASAVID